MLRGDAVVDVSDVVAEIPRVGPQDLMNGLIERSTTSGTGWRRRPSRERAGSVRIQNWAWQWAKPSESLC